MSDSPSLSLPDGPLREAYLQLHAYYSLRRGHEQAFDSLTRFLLAAATSDSHKGHLVIGPSGSGKTRLLRQLNAWLRSHLCVPDDKPDPMPVVSMTTNMTPKSLVQACMKAGGDPLAMLGTQNQTESRMSHLGRILFKNGLAIDEFHQSIDGKSARDRMAMAMTVKTICNALQKPIILMGLEGIESFIADNQELKQRFSRIAYLRNPRVQTEEDVLELCEILRDLHSLLPSDDDCVLHSPDMSRRLMVAGEGQFGAIIDFVRRACEIGAVAGRATVGRRDFAQAFDESVRAALLAKEQVALQSKSDTNPFLADRDIVKRQLARMQMPE